MSKRRVRNAPKRTARKTGIKRSKNPFSLTYMEQAAINGALATEKLTPLDALCSIHIHSKRKRLVDADGVSAKAAIDSLVLAGILSDDSSKFVKEVSYSQSKIIKGDEEETIITILEESKNE